MKNLTSICLVLALVGATLACRYPKWPEEFKWHSAGPISGMTCTHIHESADRKGTWHDNYFCHASAPGIQGINMRWSSAGKFFRISIFLYRVLKSAFMILSRLFFNFFRNFQSKMFVKAVLRFMLVFVRKSAFS